MNLYLVSRRNVSYDDFDSFIVAAEDEAAARKSFPSEIWGGSFEMGWISPDYIDTLDVKLIGLAADGVSGVILASFNAS